MRLGGSELSQAVAADREVPVDQVAPEAAADSVAILHRQLSDCLPA
jgi:hypothetical protein